MAGIDLRGKRPLALTFSTSARFILLSSLLQLACLHIMPQPFDVPGWKVPSEPVAESSQGRVSKKRKRPASDGSRLLAAGFSLEKLMDTIKEKTADLPVAKAEKAKKKKSKDKTKGNEKLKQEDKPAPAVERKISRPMPLQRGSEKRSVKHSPSKPEVLRSPKRQKTQHEEPEEASSQYTPPTEENYTTLQKSMKDKLDGAKFRSVTISRYGHIMAEYASRMINENLYKAESSGAVQMMKEDPSIFSEVNFYLTQPTASLTARSITKASAVKYKHGLRILLISTLNNCKIIPRRLS
jgi:ribosomal RNA-processing protein 8